MRVFLGITGASGAPYAKGILDGLVAAGAEVGVVVSRCLDQLGVPNALVRRWGEGASDLRSNVPGENR